MKFISTLRYLSAMPLKGLLRYMYLRFRGKDTLVTGGCNFCGACCQFINLRYEKGWITSKQQFSELVQLNSDYGRFDIVGKDNAGYLLFTCSWHTADKGCKDYLSRLDICRNYPSKSLILCGGKLLPDCGYTIGEVTPFKKYLSAELKREQYEKKSTGP